MKARRKAILTAAAVTALFSMGGCGDNNNVNVYGPAPDWPPPSQLNETAESEDTSETGETAETSETADSFKSEDNLTATVYGPPPDYEPNEKEE